MTDNTIQHLPDWLSGGDDPIDVKMARQLFVSQLREEGLPLHAERIEAGDVSRADNAAITAILLVMRGLLEQYDDDETGSATDTFLPKGIILVPAGDSIGAPTPPKENGNG